jgi:hypothetical protein
MDNTDSRVYAFCGSTPNIGTTVIAILSALHLAKWTGKSVGYFGLNLKSDKLHHYLGVAPKVTLDQLFPELESNCLTETKLLQSMNRMRDVHPNLHVLFGNQRRELAEQYTPKMIATLIQLGLKLFDYVVLDVSAYWDNAATVQCMLDAHIKVYVSTGDVSQFRVDFDAWVNRVHGTYRLPISFSDLVVTQWQDGQFHHRVSDIGRSTGISRLLLFPNMKELASELAMGNLKSILNRESLVSKLEPLYKGRVEIG